MRSLSLLAFLASFSAIASFEECPKLRGKYFCPAVVGSHKDMTMIITEARASGVVTFHYLYEQRGEPALELRYLASDQGTRNPDQGGMIGRCENLFYYNSSTGRANDKTLLNFINDDGDYEVIRNGDRKRFLLCKRLR